MEKVVEIELQPEEQKWESDAPESASKERRTKRESETIGVKKRESEIKGLE